MRNALLSTAAVAALSLSVAVGFAQTSGTGGATGTMQGGAAASGSSGSAGTGGGMTTSPGGSTGAGAAARSSGSGDTGTGTARPTTGSNERGSTAGTGGTASGSAAGRSDDATGGRAAGRPDDTSGSRAAGKPDDAPGSRAAGRADDKGGGATTTGSISVSSEQRTRLSRSFTSINVQPVTSVSFEVRTGVVLPADVTLHSCPDEVESILTGLPECRFVIVRNQVVIVEPRTRRIVTVIERAG